MLPINPCWKVSQSSPGLALPLDLHLFFLIHFHFGSNELEFSIACHEMHVYSNIAMILQAIKNPHERDKFPQMRNIHNGKDGPQVDSGFTYFVIIPSLHVRCVHLLLMP